MTAEPNAELAYRVLDQIDLDPNGWVQEVWISRADCGTVACFAGWTCLLSGDHPARADEDGEAEYVQVAWSDGAHYIPERAASLLGIDYDPDLEFGNDLFEANQSREKLGELVAEIFGPRPGGAA